MIRIVLFDNGDYFWKSRTLNSLERQTSQMFELLLYPWRWNHAFHRKFYSDFREKAADSSVYYLFLRNGIELAENAIEQLIAEISNNKAPWYYADEQLILPNNQLDIQPKPGFGIWGFCSHLYTGSAVVFSSEILKKIWCDDSVDSFQMFLLEISIKAAAICDGIHIELPLIKTPFSSQITQRQCKKISKWLTECLTKRGASYFAVAGKPGEQNSLYSLNSGANQVRFSLIVIPRKGQRQTYLQNMYAPASSIYQTIIADDSGEPVGVRMNAAAQRAENEVLWFVHEGWQLPVEVYQRELLDFATLDGIGTVSPKLLNCFGDIIYAGAGQVGNGFCSARPCNEDANSAYANGIREIMVPAWQCFAVEKKTWEKAGGFSEKDISADFCVADFALRCKQCGFTSLYCGNVSARCAEIEDPLIQQGFLEMLHQWPLLWGKDPYVTNAMCEKALGRIKKNTRLFLPPQFQPGKKRILLLTHELSMTGAPVVLISAMKVLQEAGYEQVVLSPRDGVLRENILNENIPLLIDEDIDTSPRWLSYAKEFDLIIVNTVVPFPCIEQLENLSVPVLWWIHDAKENYACYLKNVLPNTLGENISVYSVSEYARQALLEYRPEYQSSILHYGLPDYQKTDFERYIIQNPEKKQIFLTVGTIEPRKGQDILLEAIQQLDESVRSKCLFLFIGKEKSEEIFDKLQHSRSTYPGTIDWIPFLSRNDIFDAYRQSDAVICPSRDDPFPTVMAETMMQSGVCICSENTGTAAIIEHGVNGFVYHNNSPKELAACISYVAKHKSELDSLRKEARNTFESKFELTVFKEKFLGIIESLLEE